MKVQNLLITKHKNFFKNNNIKWYHTHNRDIKCSICERYNRTILNKIYKNFTSK